MNSQESVRSIKPKGSNSVFILSHSQVLALPTINQFLTPSQHQLTGKFKQLKLLKSFGKNIILFCLNLKILLLVFYLVVALGVLCLDMKCVQLRVAHWHLGTDSDVSSKVQEYGAG